MNLGLPRTRQAGCNTCGPQAFPGARLALVLLLLINLFNYVDRMVLAAVVGEIKDDSPGDFRTK